MIPPLSANDIADPSTLRNSDDGNPFKNQKNLVSYKLIFWFITWIFFVGRFQFFTKLFQYLLNEKKYLSTETPLKLLIFGQAFYLIKLFENQVFPLR